jgi:hypothetical protein
VPASPPKEKYPNTLFARQAQFFGNPFLPATIPSQNCRNALAALLAVLGAALVVYLSYTVISSL